MVAGDYLTAAPCAAEVHFSLVRFRIGLHSLPKGGDIPLQGEEDVNTGIARSHDGSTRRPKSQASGGLAPQEICLWQSIQITAALRRRRQHGAALLGLQAHQQRAMGRNLAFHFFRNAQIFVRP